MRCFSNKAALVLFREARRDFAAKENCNSLKANIYVSTHFLTRLLKVYSGVVCLILVRSKGFLLILECNGVFIDAVSHKYFIRQAYKFPLYSVRYRFPGLM